MKVVATTRNGQGTGASRRLRHLGKVPGVLYGGKAAAQAIEVDHNNLFHALRKEKFHASILDMELDGQSERVLLRAFQMHPYKPQVLHIDFQRVSEDQKVHMRVPLHFVGQENSPAVKVAGGLISHVYVRDRHRVPAKGLAGIHRGRPLRTQGARNRAGTGPQASCRRLASAEGQGEPGRRRRQYARRSDRRGGDGCAGRGRSAGDRPEGASAGAEAAKGGKEAKGGDKKK